MHSNIFQISDRPIEADDIIGIDRVTAGDMASIDYTQEVSVAERKAKIRILVESILPKGMFALCEDGETIAYTGGFTEWRKSYISNIRAKAEDIDEGNVMKWIGPAYQLKKAILNPLDTNFLFVTDFCDGCGLAERSRELMILVGNLQAGERLYIGAVLDYHF